MGITPSVYIYHFAFYKKVSNTLLRSEKNGLNPIKNGGYNGPRQIVSVVSRYRGTRQQWWIQTGPWCPPPPPPLKTWPGAIVLACFGSKRALVDFTKGFFTQKWKFCVSRFIVVARTFGDWCIRQKGTLRTRTHVPHWLLIWGSILLRGVSSVVCVLVFGHWDLKSSTVCMGTRMYIRKIHCGDSVMAWGKRSSRGPAELRRCMGTHCSLLATSIAYSGQVWGELMRSVRDSIGEVCRWYMSFS